jgi:hypothetical protein
MPTAAIEPPLPTAVEAPVGSPIESSAEPPTVEVPRGDVARAEDGPKAARESHETAVAEAESGLAPAPDAPTVEVPLPAVPPSEALTVEVPFVPAPGSALDSTETLPKIKVPRRHYFRELRRARDHGLSLFDKAARDQEWEYDDES